MASKQKQVAVLARIQWNHEDRVCYQVRASKALKDSEYQLHRHGIACVDGIEYQTVVRDGERYLVYIVCLIDGEVAGCTCPSFSKCYHKTQIQAIENKRRATKEIAAVEETVVVAEDAAFFGEDGLDNRLVSSWTTRNKRTKAEQVEFVRGFNVKLQASKELQEAS